MVTLGGSGPPVDFFFILRTACLPVIKVLLMCSVGAVLANPRVNILSGTSLKAVNKLVFVVFLPALVFYNLGSGITLQYMIQWWYMPVNVLINSLLGAALGLVIARLTQPREDLFRLTIACCVQGNLGNLPLVLVSQLCADPQNPFGGPKECLSKGIAYQAYSMWMAVVLMWTFVYNLLRNPNPTWTPLPTSEHARLDSPSVKPNLESELTKLTTSGGVQNGGAETGGQNGARYMLVGLEDGLEFSPRKIRGCLSWCKDNVKWENVLTPPVIAVIAALLVGASPVKGVLFGPEAPLKLVSEAINVLGQAMIPCMMVVLGGNLAEGPGASNMKATTISGIMLVRLVVLPLVGIGVVKLADTFGFLPPADPLFRFVMLLQFAMPTAVNIGTVATIHGVGEKEASAVLFWSYLFSIVTMTGYIMLFLLVVL